MEILAYVLAVVWIVASIFTMKKQDEIWGGSDDFCPYFNTFFLWFILLPALLIEERKNKNNKEKTPSYDIRRIARSIGYFYQSKHSHQNQHYIRECIEMLKIHGLEMKGNVLWITLGRPGLLIGKRGENIDALLKYMQNDSDLKDMKIEKINVNESIDLSALFSYEALYADYSNEQYDDLDD